MTTENTILLTGQEREDYIAKHFSPGMVVPDELMIEDKVSPEFRKAQQDFAEWYDGRGEMMKELIDSISDRTNCITEESEYDDFIEELDSEGITTAEEFEDRFECEFQFHRGLIEWVEELVDSSGYLDSVPDFIKNHIDYESIWQCELRYDYSLMEFNGKTYLFRNS